MCSPILLCPESFAKLVTVVLPGASFSAAIFPSFFSSHANGGAAWVAASYHSVHSVIGSLQVRNHDAGKYDVALASAFLSQVSYYVLTGV
jgi:hypothetical protein